MGTLTTEACFPVYLLVGDTYLAEQPLSEKRERRRKMSKRFGERITMGQVGQLATERYEKFSRKGFAGVLKNAVLFNELGELAEILSTVDECSLYECVRDFYFKLFCLEGLSNCNRDGAYGMIRVLLSLGFNIAEIGKMVPEAILRISGPNKLGKELLSHEKMWSPYFFPKIEPGKFVSALLAQGAIRLNGLTKDLLVHLEKEKMEGVFAPPPMGYADGMVSFNESIEENGMFSPGKMEKRFESLSNFPVRLASALEIVFFLCAYREITGNTYWPLLKKPYREFWFRTCNYGTSSSSQENHFYVCFNPGEICSAKVWEKENVQSFGGKLTRRIELLPIVVYSYL